LGGQEWTYRKSKKKHVLATEVFFRGNLLESDEINCPELETKKWGFTQIKNPLVFPEEDVETEAEKKRRLRAGINPDMNCRFCGRKFNDRSNCIRHERDYCRAPGAMHHPAKCDPKKCQQNCKGRASHYEPPPSRR